MAWAASCAAHEGNDCGEWRCSGCPPGGTVPALGSPGGNGGTGQCWGAPVLLLPRRPWPPELQLCARSSSIPPPQPSPALSCSTLRPRGEGTLHPIAELTQQRITCVVAHWELLQGLWSLHPPGAPAQLRIPTGGCSMLGGHCAWGGGMALCVGEDTAGVPCKGEQGSRESWGLGLSCTGCWVCGVLHGGCQDVVLGRGSCTECCGVQGVLCRGCCRLQGVLWGAGVGVVGC